MTSATERVPAELDALAGARDRLAAALAAERWGDDAAIRVMTASTEALANALEHGSGPGARVEMAFGVTRRAASVRVTDAGRPGRPADLVARARGPPRGEHPRPRTPADAGDGRRGAHPAPRGRAPRCCWGSAQRARLSFRRFALTVAVRG